MPTLFQNQEGSVMKGKADDTKDRWIRRHAERLWRRWYRGQAPFRVAPEYVRQLERDLERFYEHPLMRSFVENTD